jgi:two-component system response regulator
VAAHREIVSFVVTVTFELVFVARDGAETLNLIFCSGETAAHAGVCPPRLILLDLKLPKIDGVEVLRRIRADARTGSIPVVAPTASREERDIIESYDLGADSYIVEQVDFEQFVDAVRLGYVLAFLNEPPTQTKPAQTR